MIDGTSNGLSKQYYENGKLQQEELKNGEDGIWKFYDESGNITDEILFKDGEEV